MPSTRLNPQILNILVEKTGLTVGTIRNNISLVRTDYPNCTLNAAAQIFARSKGFTVLQKLSKDDKKTLPNFEVVTSKIKIEKKKTTNRDRIIEFIDYETDEYFKKGHIQEINKAYTKGCYTSVHILARKIIENLIREILSIKFPPTNAINKKLYYDISKQRFKDFSVILKNLYDKRNDFGPDNSKIIKRLYQKAKNFKDDSNDATHSWYYLIERRKEIDDLNIQSIVELIKKLEK